MNKHLYEQYVRWLKHREYQHSPKRVKEFLAFYKKVKEEKISFLDLMERDKKLAGKHDAIFGFTVDMKGENIHNMYFGIGNASKHALAQAVLNMAVQLLFEGKPITFDLSDVNMYEFENSMLELIEKLDKSTEVNKNKQIC